jgi:general secretion pathway protein J
MKQFAASSSFPRTRDSSVFPTKVADSPPSRQAGFTLLELTIALVLFALLSAVAFGSLRLAGRSWDSGEAKAAQSSDMRQTEQFLREQLSAQYPQRARKVAEFPLLFAGASDELRFSAALPPRVAEGGVYYFRLAVAKDGERSQLVLERVVPNLEAPSDITFDRADRSVLADGIAELRIEYFGRDAGAHDTVAPTWRDHWDDKQRLPLLMRVSVKPEHGPAWPQLVVEPRRAPESGCRAWAESQQRCTGNG